MNFEPQTYEELIRMKRCVELTKYYEVTEEELWEIYHFLEQEPEAFIKGGRQNLSLIIGQNTATTQKVIMANCTDSSIDGILLSRTEFKVFPHYTPSSGSGSSGGSSSNNNNNNNTIITTITDRTRKQWHSYPKHFKCAGLQKAASISRLLTSSMAP
jgi:hypothetical protein